MRSLRILWHWLEHPEVADPNGSRLQRRVSVFLNGRDISKSCYRAELYAGFLLKAYCFKRDALGRLKLTPDRREVIREIRWGAGLFEYLDLA